jgi:hypothetical protein
MPPAFFIASTIAPERKRKEPGSARRLTGLLMQSRRIYKIKKLLFQLRHILTPWRSCKYDPPYIGRYVEITRDQVHTDFVWWYPKQGNWQAACVTAYERVWRERAGNKKQKLVNTQKA